MISICSLTTFFFLTTNLHVCPFCCSESQESLWSFVTISLRTLFSQRRWHLLVTNFQCGIVCPELGASVNGWSYAKHISYIGVTICLCAAIYLRLDADSSRSGLSFSRIFLPSQGRPLTTTQMAVSQVGAAEGPLVDKPWHAQKHACAQQMPTRTEPRASECVLVNDKFAVQDNRALCGPPERFSRSLTGWPSSVTHARTRVQTTPLAFSSNSSHLHSFYSLLGPWCCELTNSGGEIFKM